MPRNWARCPRVRRPATGVRASLRARHGAPREGSCVLQWCLRWRAHAFPRAVSRGENVPDRLSVVINEACADLPNASAEAVLAETKRNLYDGITEAELALAPIM